MKVTSSKTDRKVQLTIYAIDNGILPPDDFVKIPLPIVSRCARASFVMTGIISNILVIIVILRHTKLWRQKTCKYIVNQSVIDAMTLTVFLVRVHMIPIDRWQLARMDDLQVDVYCRLWGSPFLMYGLLLSSTYNLVAISVERYLGFVKPFWHKVSFTHERVMGSIVAIWLFGVCYTALVVAVPSRMVDGECQPARHRPSPGVQTFVGSITLVVSLVLPLGIHAF